MRGKGLIIFLATTEGRREKEGEGEREHERERGKEGERENV